MLFLDVKNDVKYDFSCKFQNQDRRRSYSRPEKQYRKRHISVDSEHEEDEDEDLDKNDNDRKKSKPKRRKKLIESNPKVCYTIWFKYIQKFFCLLDTTVALH